MKGGISMQMVVRGYLTYEITSSPFKLGLVSAGFALPMLSLSVFGGAVADRMERKKVIQSGQALAGFLALFVVVSISTGTVTWVYLLVTSTAHEAVVAFLVPARQAIIPQLVGQTNLTNAFALAAAAMSATPLFTPSVAGGLYAAFGPDAAYSLIASLMVVSIVLTGLVRAGEGGRDKAYRPYVEGHRRGAFLHR